MISVASV